MSSSTRDGGEKHFKGLTKYFMWLVLCCVVLCSGDGIRLGLCMIIE